MRNRKHTKDAVDPWLEQRQLCHPTIAIQHFINERYFPSNSIFNFNFSQMTFHGKYIKICTKERETRDEEALRKELSLIAIKCDVNF